MEILIIIVIGLIAKNFKAIMEFLAEQGQQYGPPPIAKNSGGKPYLSKKVPTEFEYEEDYYDKPKAYKVKSSQTGQNEQLSTSLDSTSVNKKSNFDQSGVYDQSNGLNQSYNAKQISTSNQNNDSNQNFDENLIQLDDLKKGVIWQEILEPPRSRRPYRKII